MEQEKIWDFFQNDDASSNVFEGARPRYKFIAKNIVPGVNILNIGVGRGGLEAMLIKKGCIVNCLDPSRVAINKVRDQYDLGDRAKVGYSQSIPFAECQFDVVVMSEVLEHLTDEVLNATIVEVKRVLNYDGTFIITVPANEKLPDNITVCPKCSELYHRWGHLQTFSIERLRQLMTFHGFVFTRCEVRAFPDWQRAGLVNLFKSAIRYILGRAGSKISNPNFYLEVKVRLDEHEFSK